MARPQKFRHSREALTDPQIAAKLGGLVLDIEALRTKRKQIDDQIAAAFDAVDDAGFEKKYVRKVVSLRAKETDARRDEEEGLEAYEFAVEKGVSLACARSKPVSSQSYAEAKGRDHAGSSSGRTAEFDSANAGSNPAPVTSGELTDTQEQPETVDEFQAKASEDNGATGTANVEVPSDSMAGEVSRLDAGRTASATSERMDVTAGETAPHSPSPANTPRLAADDEAAQANPTSSAPLSSSVTPPPPGETDKAEADSSPASAVLSDADVPQFLKPEQRKSIADYRPNCLNPDACGATGLQHCYTCRKAMEAASETEAA